MTNVLQNFTEHKSSKIHECISSVGKYSDKPAITSANRNVVRGWLNGIGFTTEVYINTSLEDLQRAYWSCGREGRGLSLIPFIWNSGCKEPSEVLSNLLEAIRRLGGTFEGTIPELSDVVGYIKYSGLSVAPSQPAAQPASAASEPAPFWKDGANGAKPVTDATYTDIKTTKTEGEPMDNTEAQKAIAMLMAAISKPQKVAEIDESRVIELIKKHGASTEVVIKKDGKTHTVPTGLHHEALPMIVKMLEAGVNVMLVGAAGSGKTTIADQCAKILGIPFYFNGALSSEYKLSGFVDAQGRIVSTAFRKAYETGGLYLFDEIDASMPDALLAFNAALANGHADFPDGSINRHENFKCMAAANTYGKGADRIYVGRNQLDGASLDRFAVINVDYDEKLEKNLAGNDDWTNTVQKIRKAVYDLKIRHIVSPRASIQGAKLLAVGIKEKDVMEMVIWKGLDKDSITKIKNQANV